MHVKLVSQACAFIPNQFYFLISRIGEKLAVHSTGKPIKTNADPAGDQFLGVFFFLLFFSFMHQQKWKELFLFFFFFGNCTILIGTIGLVWGLITQYEDMGGSAESSLSEFPRMKGLLQKPPGVARDRLPKPVG